MLCLIAMPRLNLNQLKYPDRQEINTLKQIAPGRTFCAKSNKIARVVIILNGLDEIKNKFLFFTG